MKAVSRVPWLALLLASCATTPDVVATWYLSRNCDRLQAIADESCKDNPPAADCLAARNDINTCERDSKPRLYIGLLNRSSKSLSVEYLKVNDKSYLLDQTKVKPPRLDAGRIVFFDLQELELPPENGQEPYWGCHVPVVATLTLTGGGTVGVESISTMPSALTSIWRTRCVFPPL
ncbi:MAG: hypothetical protein EYC67_11080 [Betaproteobacteria bacterium]|nr:MAG: hypothetical protein EYC67_11080 [Betaproteobacteria bacterium]